MGTDRGAEVFAVLALPVLLFAVDGGPTAKSSRPLGGPVDLMKSAKSPIDSLSTLASLAIGALALIREPDFEVAREAARDAVGDGIERGISAGELEKRPATLLIELLDPVRGLATLEDGLSGTFYRTLVFALIDTINELRTTIVRIL
jgi:hypothetical protein